MKFGAFLDEAEELAELGQAASAVLIAGTILEYFERSPTANAVQREHLSNVAAWRQLRNQVAHGSAREVNVQQALQVIQGVRQILMTANKPGGSPSLAASAARQIKGKYAHVPTSSDDFIKRKGEELELEDRG